MSKKYYTFATGKKGGALGLNHDAYGIMAFTANEKAKEKLTEILAFVKRNANELEGKVIDITPLVQMGIIPLEKLRIRE